MGLAEGTRGREESLVRILIILCVAGALVAVSAQASWAQDSDRPRGYFGLKFFDTNPATGVHDLYGFSLGANLNRYFGAELSFQEYEVFPDIPPYGTITEYGVFTIIPQARLRYPLFGDRLVPYVFGGVGFGLTGLNDRKPKGFGLSIQDSTKTTVAGTLGLGIEYYVADNIALGIEGSYLFAPDATIMVQGVPEKVKISAPLVTFGMRLLYPEVVAAPMAEARKDVPARLYIGARAGGALNLDTDLIPGVQAEPSNNAIGGALSPTFGASLGLNFGRYFGVEVAADGFEVNMDVNGLGNIGEWAFYSIIPYFRLRYPMARDRLQPYLLAGFGYGHTEFNDRKPPGANIEVSADNGTWAMGVGAGVEYFVTSNIALGMEMKYLYSPGHSIKISSGPAGDATVSALLFTVGLRAFLFDFPGWKPSPLRGGS
jgi:opacity protein-like surface antigen